MWYNRNNFGWQLNPAENKKDAKYVSLVNQSALWWSSAQATVIHVDMHKHLTLKHCKDLIFITNTAKYIVKSWAHFVKSCGICKNLKQDLKFYSLSLQLFVDCPAMSFVLELIWPINYSLVQVCLYIAMYWSCYITPSANHLAQSRGDYLRCKGQHFRWG